MRFDTRSDKIYTANIEKTQLTVILLHFVQHMLKKV